MALSYWYKIRSDVKYTSQENDPLRKHMPSVSFDDASRSNAHRRVIRYSNLQPSSVYPFDVIDSKRCSYAFLPFFFFFFFSSPFFEIRTKYLNNSLHFHKGIKSMTDYLKKFIFNPISFYNLIAIDLYSNPIKLHTYLCDKI